MNKDKSEKGTEEVKTAEEKARDETTRAVEEERLAKWLIAALKW